MQTNIERLKTVLPSIESILELKKETATECSGVCPRCGGEDRFRLWPETGKFWCRQCDWRGDVVDYHCHAEGTNISGLIKKKFLHTDHPPVKKKGVAPSKPIHPDFSNYIDSRLKSNGVTGIHAYLCDVRKIDRPVVDKTAGICFGEAYSVEAKCTKPAVSCSYRTLTGETVAIQHIFTDGTGTGKQYQKGSNAKTGFFIAGKPFDSADRIVIVESVVNALSIAQVDQTCAVAIGSTTTYRKLKSLKPVLNGKPVIVFFDADNAGIQASYNVERIIPGTLAVVWPEGTPEKMDVNDLLRNGRHDQIKEMIQNAAPLQNSVKNDSVVPDGVSPFRLTDVGNCERMARDHGKNIRFIPQWGKWFIWNGKNWEQDDSFEIFKLAKKSARRIYTEAADCLDDKHRQVIARHAALTEKAANLKSMIDLTRSEDNIPTIPDRFDANHWLFNCQNGTIDLKTGKRMPHNRNDLITKISPAIHDPAADCPLWMSFLDRIMNGNLCLIEFIQHAIGYSLTGDVGEQCLFFLHGSGANGKSTFIDVISNLFAEYGQQSDFSTFLIKDSDAIRNDLARMKGARFIAAVEVGAGRNFSEVVVKQLTGGDKITARFLRQEFFEFYPTFKIWLAANHKPVIRGTDHAIWRRLKLIPFNVTIPEVERDSKLPEKLKTELSGIFNWAVAGCMAWQVAGLGEPAEVKHATDTYRQEMDVLSGFIEDRCVINPITRVYLKDLFHEYQRWCAENKEPEIKKLNFNGRIEEKGFSKDRDGKGLFWRGIGLVDQNENNLVNFVNSDEAFSPINALVEPRNGLYPKTLHKTSQNSQPNDIGEMCEKCPAYDAEAGLCHGESYFNHRAARPMQVDHARIDCPKNRISN